MNKRWIWITMGALAILGALSTGAVAGTALALLGRDARPALAARSVLQDGESDNGVLVAGVEEGSPAAQAGIQRGDILVRLDGQELTSAKDLLAGLTGKQPNDSIELAALHGDERRTFTVTLGERNGRAYLGVQPCWHDEVGALIQLDVQPGALLGEVTAGGPADQAGLKEGDVILSVNGRQPGTDADLGEIIRSYQPGDTVTLEVRRSGETETVSIEVTLGENPAEAGAAYLGVKYHPVSGVFRQDGQEMPFNPFGGFWDDNIPGLPGAPLDQPIFRHAFPALPAGVEQAIMVGSVADGSPAQQAGLQSGDLITAIDGEPVGNPDETAANLRSRNPGDPVSLTVYRQATEDPLIIDVTLGEHPEQAGQAYLGVTLSGYLEVHTQEGGSSEPDSNLPFFREEPFKPGLPFPSEPGMRVAPDLEI